MTRLAQINAVSAAQIAPYPRGTPSQNTFRSVLYNLSMHALGRRATFGLDDAFAHAVRMTRATYPNFTPNRS
jgi:hypothetical protein